MLSLFPCSPVVRECSWKKTQIETEKKNKKNTVSKIKLINERISIKEFRGTGNLNGANAGRIMAKISPGIEMWTKVIYLFKSKIHRGAGETVDYSQTFTSPPGMFTSLEEIQSYIEEFGPKKLDLDNVQV